MFTTTIPKIAAVVLCLLCAAAFFMSNVLQTPAFVSQAMAAPGDFVTTWQTTTAGETITIPTTGGGYAYNVDWGDGTTDATVYSGDATHAYAAPGVYTVAISGTFPRIFFDNDTVINPGNKEKIISVEQWGDGVWTSMDNAFFGASNLVVNAVDSPDLSAVTSMNGMFREALVMNQSINHWDVSNVQSFFGMFEDAVAFNQPLDNWDMSSSTNLGVMFKRATSFNQDLCSWDVSGVTLAFGIFNNATSFNQDLSCWNVTSLTGVNGGRNMVSNSGLSTLNYDKLLISWASQPVMAGVEFGAVGIQYCSDEAAAARASLITDGWTIFDGGRAPFPGCLPPVVAEIEFETATSSKMEDVPGLPPNLLISGTVTATSTFTVGLSGTTDGSDYTIATTTFEVVPGVYASTTPVALTGLTINSDTDVESDETLVFTIATTTGDLVIGDASNNATTQTAHTCTILNDDAAVVPPGTSSGGGSGGGPDIRINDVATSCSETTITGEIRDKDEWELYYVVSDTDQSPSCTDDEHLKFSVPGTQNEDDVFNIQLTGLSPDTEYHARLCGMRDGTLDEDSRVETFNTLTGQSCVAPTEVVEPPVASVLSSGAYQFTKTFGHCQCGPEAQELQRWFNQNGYTVNPNSGLGGSLNNETHCVGDYTLAQIQKFQADQNLAIAPYLNSATRDAINQMIQIESEAGVVFQGLERTMHPHLELMQNFHTGPYPVLEYGDQGHDPSILMTLLIDYGYLEVPEHDALIGATTVNALQAFQFDHGLFLTGKTDRAVWDKFAELVNDGSAPSSTNLQPIISERPAPTATQETEKRIDLMTRVVRLLERILQFRLAN